MSRLYHGVLVDAFEQHLNARLRDQTSNLPTTKRFLGTYVAAEASDANLSIVNLQGGRQLRYVPKVKHVALTVSDVVILEETPLIPAYIVGVFVGNIGSAVASTGDSVPPTAPSSLTSPSHTSTTINLSWTASTDASGISKYDVYLNGAFNQSVAGTTAVVRNLTQGTAYTMYVVAWDAAGNLSGPSNSVNVTTSTDVPAPGTLVTKQYAALWSGTWNYNNHQEFDSFFGNACYQGRYTGAGQMYSFIGFDATGQIVADMAGHTPSSCKVRLTPASWYSSDRLGTAVVGAHGFLTKPGNNPAGSSMHRDLAEQVLQKGSSTWVDLGVASAAQFASGSYRGVMLGWPPTNAIGYFGYFYGFNSGVYAPILQLQWRY